MIYSLSKNLKRSFIEEELKQDTDQCMRNLQSTFSTYYKNILIN